MKQVHNSFKYNNIILNNLQNLKTMSMVEFHFLLTTSELLFWGRIVLFT